DQVWSRLVCRDTQSIVVGIRPTNRRFAAVVRHAPQHLADFLFVHESIAVGIDAFEAVSQKRWRFLLRDFAVLIGVGFLQPSAEFLRVHAPESALAGAALAWRTSGWLAWARRRVARTAGHPAGSKHLVGRQFAIAVLVELQQH